MPPRARASRPAEAKPARAEAEICKQCWPDGWPTDDTSGASCIHGVWTR